MTSMRVCLQWTVIFFSVTSLIIGILAIVAAVYELEKFNEGSAEHMEKIVQLVAAAVLVLSAFIGCVGAVNGSIKVLCAVIVVLLALIVTHIWKLWRYNESDQLTATEEYVSFTWIDELVHPGAMQKLQRTYECCGKKSHVDYTSTRLNIPRSCYYIEDGRRWLYTEGCMSAVKLAYLEVYRFEKWTHAALIGYELLGIILAATLCSQLITKTLRYNY